MFNFAVLSALVALTSIFASLGFTYVTEGHGLHPAACAAAVLVLVLLCGALIHLGALLGARPDCDCNCDRA